MTFNFSGVKHLTKLLSIFFDDYLDFLKIEESAALKILREESFSGTGPGGQHRNRVKTGIRLIHPQWKTQGECSQYREGKRNRREALENLRKNLDSQVEFPFKYFLAEWLKLPKGKINIHNPKYPIWRAAVKALWRESDFQTQGLRAQEFWSPTAIIKQCAQDPQLWQWIQQEREKRSMHALKRP